MYSRVTAIRHLRNKKRIGAEKCNSIISGVVTRDVPVSYWPVFSSLSLVTVPQCEVNSAQFPSCLEVANGEWRMANGLRGRRFSKGKRNADVRALSSLTTSTELFKNFVFVVQTSQRLLKATELPIRLTWPGLKRRALAGTNFVSMYLHSSKKSGFSKWPNTLKTRRKDHLFYNLGSNGERDKQMIDQIHLLYTLEHVNNLRGEARFIDIHLSTKKRPGSVQKVAHPNKPPSPAPLEKEWA